MHGNLATAELPKTNLFCMGKQFRQVCGGLVDFIRKCKMKDERVS
jgi:hypothetical protein